MIGVGFSLSQVFYEETVMEDGPKNEDQQMGMWIGIGVALGVALGTMFDNLGLGVAVGVALGAAIGAVSRNRPPSSGDSEED
jgi:F0F1-type ATP synthase membrane subunit c/vacuolar-type H+-ATPase subunit K